MMALYEAVMVLRDGPLTAFDVIDSSNVTTFMFNGLVSTP